MFEHYCLLNSIIEIKITVHAPKYRTLTISLKFSVIHVLKCSKHGGNRPKWLKIFKNYHFY